MDAPPYNPAPSIGSEAQTLKLAIEHARRGNAVGARILMADICNREPGNELAWLWRASLATTADEGLNFMGRVLQINPQNATALGWLAKMGRPAPSAAPAPPPATPVATLAAAVSQPPVAPAVTPARTLAECPICEARIAPDALRCPQCRAVLLMKDPMDFALARTLDAAVAHAALARWQSSPAANGLEAALALATVCLNILDYAGATAHLRKALSLGLPHPPPLLVRDGLLLKTLMQPVVMVVDDSATIRDVVVRSLAPHEVLPLPVSNAWDVLPAMLQQKPALVLLDVTMPGMDGFEVCRKIRANKETKQTPVIMLTGHDDFIDKLVGKMAGASEYLTKPFKPEVLLHTVRKHLAKRRAP